MPDRAILETFPNPHGTRDYLIEHHVREFTSLCPKTSQPDFARVRIRYVADAACIELRGLKLYLQTFRDTGIFYEDVTNGILNDLVSCCQPKWMAVRLNETELAALQPHLTKAKLSIEPRYQAKK